MAGCKSALHMDFWPHIVNDRCFCKMKCCFKSTSIALFAHKQPWFNVTAGCNLFMVSLPDNAQCECFAAYYVLYIVQLLNKNKWPQLMYGFHMHFGMLWSYKFHISIASSQGLQYFAQSTLCIISQCSHIPLWKKSEMLFISWGSEGQRSTQKALLEGWDKLHLCWVGPHLKQGCKVTCWLQTSKCSVSL